MPVNKKNTVLGLLFFICGQSCFCGMIFVFLWKKTDCNGKFLIKYMDVKIFRKKALMICYFFDSSVVFETVSLE